MAALRYRSYRTPRRRPPRNGRPNFELLDWDLRVLSNGGWVNPDGLLRADGRGRGANGIRPWTAALKVITLAPAEVPPTHIGYFQRESRAYAEGALAALAGPIRAARCCGATEEDTGARIWLELLEGRSGRAWDLADYAFAGASWAASTPPAPPPMPWQMYPGWDGTWRAVGCPPLTSARPGPIPACGRCSLHRSSGASSTSGPNTLASWTPPNACPRSSRTTTIKAVHLSRRKRGHLATGV